MHLKCSSCGRSFYLPTIKHKSLQAKHSTCNKICTQTQITLTRIKDNLESLKIGITFLSLCSHCEKLVACRFPNASGALAALSCSTDRLSNMQAWEACKEACDLFGAEHAYVQPHSGADANMVAYWAILSKVIQEPWLEEMEVKDVSKLSREDWDVLRAKLGNQRLFGLNYYSGGHLTHGYRHNMSASKLNQNLT